MQAEAYNNVFDRMTLVVGERLLMDSIKIIPEWRGIKIAKLRQNSFAQHPGS